MALLSDIEIKVLLEGGMISPYEVTQISKVGDLRVISYGLSSCGYDIRLSPIECFSIRNDGPIDPKNTNKNVKKSLPLITDESGSFFIIPPMTYVLAATLETFDMPLNVCATAVGKSTYARCGLIVNVTPLEPGWKGFLTLELYNAGMEPLKIYTNEGIAQLQFQRVIGCETSYSARNGKYMNQPANPMMAKLG